MSRAKRNSAIALAVLSGIFAFSFLADIETVRSIPLCFFKSLTHLDCPGCGLTRSFISLSHGHWIEALRYNALGPFVYLYLLAYLLKHFLSIAWGIEFSWALPAWSSYLLLGLVFGQWFFKMWQQIPQIIS